VAGSCEYGDEHAGSAATELVSYNFLTPSRYAKLWRLMTVWRNLQISVQVKVKLKLIC
jgi:hypothetical protein